MEWLAKVLIKAIASYISLWLSKKKAERLEVKVKKMEIAAEVKEVEASIENSAFKRAPDRHLTPEMWNRPVRMKSRSMLVGKMIVLFALFIGGCGEVKYIEGKWPMVKVPDRPVIAETPEFSERESKIADYGVQLEEAIKQYNSEAEAHNEKHGHTE